MNPTRLTRRTLLMSACAVAAITIGAPARTQARAGIGRKPNILFIMADDLGYADLSCYGQTAYATPVIDRLAADGLKLMQGYASSAVCSATRTALATGHYPQRFAIGLEEPVGPNDNLSLPAGTPTIASRLKKEGYRTALVGKWHVGAIPHHGPTRFGYDHFFGISSGSADYFGHAGAPAAKTSNRGGLFLGEVPVTRNGYLTDLFADEANRWIGEKSESPFFLSLHFNAPHWPWEGPKDEQHSRTLQILRDPAGGSLETYAEMVRAMDAAIGRVLAQLATLGMDRDTLIVFTSDNGGERYSNTWPFTGTKGELLEGGIRVPLIINWPNRIGAGQTSDQVMTSMDFMPTLLAAAGAAPLSPKDSDGANLLPQILGDSPVVSRTLFWRYKANEQSAIRDGDWKYLSIGGKEHLFHVSVDPRERAELKDVHPDIFYDLKQKYEKWNKDVLPYIRENSSEDVKDIYADRY